MKLDQKRILSEVTFKTVRSRGKGGQHVNKVATRVELYFSVNDSDVLSDEQKSLVLKKLSKRTNKNGVMIFVSDESRSQFANKEQAKKKFLNAIEKALTIQKKRIASEPSHATKEKRLREKKMVSEKKKLRTVKFEE
jgi:ribosome-associated protein